MTMVQEAIEHGRDGRGVAEQLPQSSIGWLKVTAVVTRS
jgi:hypothetical protein